MCAAYPYPKAQPQAARRDAWPPDGGLPGSDLDFMREQHLDLYGVDYGVMNPLSPTGQGEQNPEFSAAMALAANEWQLEHWNRREPRLKASVVVPYEDGEAARAEIKRRAGNRHFAHVLLLSRTSEPLGKRRYWPIYEAAVEAGLAGRHPRLRLQRLGDDQRRLAVVLYRGDDRARRPPARRW